MNANGTSGSLGWIGFKDQDRDLHLSNDCISIAPLALEAHTVSCGFLTSLYSSLFLQDVPLLLNHTMGSPSAANLLLCTPIHPKLVHSRCTRPIPREVLKFMGYVRVPTMQEIPYRPQATSEAWEASPNYTKPRFYCGSGCYSRCLWAWHWLFEVVSLSITIELHPGACWLTYSIESTTTPLYRSDEASSTRETVKNTRASARQSRIPSAQRVSDNSSSTSTATSSSSPSNGTG